MTELLTAAQMRAIEQAAIASGEVTGLQLMERAGRGVVEAMFKEWPDLAQGAHRAVVLCGPGNNGGDGFVVARRLRDKGWTVEVFLYGDPSRLPPDAARMHEIWLTMGDVAAMTPDLVGQGPRPTLLIDAIFGTGLTRPIPLDCALAFSAVENRETGKKTHPWLVPFYKVAVDCASGMDSDSGHVLFPARPPDDEIEEDTDRYSAFMDAEVYPRMLHTDLCVTFHRAKVGHYLTDIGRRAPFVVDIGLEPDRWQKSPSLSDERGDRVVLAETSPDEGRHSGNVWIKSLGNVPNRHQNKYDRGHALVLAGGPGHGGAARLAARAALRAGAGLVSVGAPQAAMIENACQLNAIMLRQVDGPDALTEMLGDERINAVCLGPGLGSGKATMELVETALSMSDISHGHDKRRFVLDADALTSFSDDPRRLFDICHDHVVLTPHDGEFKRLFPDLSKKLGPSESSTPPLSRVEAARLAAKRSGATVLLKGAASVIAAPEGGASIHAALYDRAAPWLATAGAGDVLAGIILGLLANPMAGFHLLQTVELAAWLHVECALKFGPGLIAEDLPEVLPAVFADLGL